MCLNCVGKFVQFECVNFLDQKTLTHSICQASSNRLQCQYPNCSKTFETHSGRKSHIDRQHQGKKFKCKFCTKRLSSRHSVLRHIAGAHQNDEIEGTETEIVYNQVEEIVPQSQEDAVIQQQSEKINQLQNEWKGLQDEIKILRQQVKSKRSSKSTSTNAKQ